MHMSVGSDSQKLELQAAVSQVVGMLEIELLSSGRTVCALSVLTAELLSSPKRLILETLH